MMISFLNWIFVHQQTLSLLAAAFLTGVIVATPDKRKFFE